jgi:hypothetical protein
MNAHERGTTLSDTAGMDHAAPPEDDDCCQWCGEPGTAAEPLAETCVSPPVSGYPVEIGLYHAACSAAAARSAVE